MICARAAPAVVAFLYCACTPPRAPVTPRTVEPAAELLDRLISDSVPGFSGQVLVARAGEVLLHKAYGLADRETARPNTVTTVFDVGSVTKQFTAAAVVALESDGRLAVTDTVGKYFAGLRPSIARITLHQLLTHTSGMPQYSGEDYEPRTDSAFAAWLDTVSLEFDPGTKFQYSNPGYSTLALVVQKVSAMPYEEFLQTRLLRPAGLTRTGYRAHDWSRDQLATGYTLGAERFGSPLEHFWHSDGPSWNLRGNGGLLSSAAELYRWQQSLLAGRVLPKSAVACLVTGHVDTQRAGRRYGYGWYASEDDAGRRSVEHTGGNGAFFALVRWYDESGVVIVVTSNAFRADTIRALLAHVVRVAVDGARPG